MRKILLATAAIVGLSISASAHAATAPLTVSVGGSTDFLAGNFSSSNQGNTTSFSSNHRDFESIYALDFSVSGKAGNGVEYGGMLGLTNAPDISNAFEGTQTSPYMNNGYVWLSGAFGKLQLGDSHGATDLVVTTPVVGEGQVLGRYIDFLDSYAFAKNFPLGIDSSDHSTNLTYFTPKVGNADNKVQIAVSYVPQFYNDGSGVVSYNSGNISGTGSNTLSPYRDVAKAAIAYTGKIAPVAVSASAEVYTGNSSYTSAGLGTGDTWIQNAPAGFAEGFTAVGVGGQAALDGITFGGSYLNEGRYDTVVGQNKLQDQFTMGAKYDFNKVSVGLSYLGAQGYSNMLSTTGSTVSTNNDNYIKDFYSYGAGTSYVWAPGLTSNLDGVYFEQKSDVGIKNDGYVLLVSQKLAF